MASILRAQRNYWCEAAVDHAGLLVDGDDYYRAFYEAAQKAERYIVLTGWQFDSDACLLRGPEAQNAKLPVTLVKFLDTLCEAKKDLSIYLLAWDFHAVFGLEREWMQELKFHWTTNERLHFRFDSAHADEGCHHQKFVVIDGQLSFLGGLDLCDHRWDDRSHRDANPLRISRGEPHKPFHDVQAYFVGSEIAENLAQLFACRWEAAGGKPISLETVGTSFSGYRPEGAVELAAERVALSRTDPHGSPTKALKCREVCDLHLDAIARAESLIYIETQYFSSQELGAALAARIADVSRPPLEIVVVLNMKAETLKEEVAVGLAQAKVISELRAAAQGTPHRLGIYYSVPASEDGKEPERATYIHSKLMIVDDRFLTVGSANLTNRSTCVDTELNASMETERRDTQLGKSITHARLSLIAEHLGVSEFAQMEGLVARLDELAALREGRLRLHPSPTEKERKVLDVIDPQQLPFDPASLEDLDEDKSIFVGGLGALWTKMLGGGSGPSSAA
jgi:phosphatidylserine/phosphatidylglycerophosphate/cardiolipin synthase-like enzyme